MKLEEIYNLLVKKEIIYPVFKNLIDKLYASSIYDYKTVLMTVNHQEANFEDRVNSTILLSYFPQGKRFKKVIEEALLDDNYKIKKYSIQAINCYTKFQDLKIQLLKMLENETNEEVKCEIIEKLKFSTDLRIILPFLNILNDKAIDENLRDLAAEGLGEMGEFSERLGEHKKEVIESLILALKDESGKVRYSAAFSLGKIGNKSALPALEELAQADDNFNYTWGTVSEEAKKAIDRIGA